MLDREFARKLLPLVNHKIYDDLQELISYLLEQATKEYSNAKDWNDIRFIQGKIRQLERFMTLRNEVIADSKDKLIDKSVG